jgi:nitrogen PTS system EIIA component
MARYFHIGCKQEPPSMFPPQFLVADRIGSGVDVASKKRLLQTLAELLATGDATLSSEAVLESLLERERLGSTGLGHGIALPHSRMTEVGDARCAFVQLLKGVDYDAIDGEPVDLALALLVPEAATETHLQLLSALATMFSDERLRQSLRGATSPEQVLALFDAWDSPTRRP